MLNDYGINGSSTNRKTMKSPTSNALSLKTIDESKHLRRKYE